MSDPWPMNGADAVCSLCQGRGWMQTDDEEVDCPRCHGREAELPRTLAGRALLVWVGLQGVGNAETVSALIRAAEKEAAGAEALRESYQKATS